MPLTDVKVRNARPSDRQQKLFDGGGLFLLVTKSGGKLWRLKYRFAGKEQLLALGAYPQVSLADARKKRDTARGQLTDGVNPAAVRRASKASTGGDFESVAREWHTRFKSTWTEKHAALCIRALERDVFKWIGTRPVGAITAAELLSVVRRVEARGALDTAHRVLQISGQVLRFAVSTGRAERDPSVDLRGSLAAVKPVHHASITAPDKIGGLLRAIDGYEGAFITKSALQLAPLVFVRPGELRGAEWPEFNLDGAEWRIPAGRMKMGAVHIVPLSTQAVKVLRTLEPLTGSGRFVFPSVRSTSRCMSNGTINAALRRLGFEKDEMTGHGFRSMASTLLNEHGWNRDAIERQLAHAERSEIRAAYNYAEHLGERRRMMQAWADYLDELKAGKPAKG